MKRTLLLATLIAQLGGCYLGKSPARKAGAYAINGTMVLASIGGIANAQDQGSEGDLVGRMLLVPLLAGLTGIVINLAAN